MLIRYRGLALIFTLCLSIVQVYGQTSDNSQQARDLHLGQRMYLEGLRPNGEPISGKINGDIEISGENVICGTCHRRSGLGSSEGNSVVPGVTAELLYKPLTLPTSRPPDPPVLRPAYTAETVRRAIREGVGASGQMLSNLMPRYDLSDSEIDVLAKYMRTLSQSISEGVTETEIHLATIVSDSVPDDRRNAMLQVLNTFIQQKNVETRNESQRSSTSPWHKDWAFKSYRKWVLHVWELTGPEDSYPAQLERAYADAPVFAVIGGVTTNDWRPVHEFCTSKKLPCVFPNTSLPVVDQNDFYNVYFTEGVELEARVIAKYLQSGDGAGSPVIQVLRNGDAVTERGARVLADKLGNRITTHSYVGEGSIPASYWRELLAGQPQSALMVWLPAAEQAGLWDFVTTHNGDLNVYFSSAGQEKSAVELPASEHANVFFVRTSALPEKLPRLLARSTGWFRSRRIYEPQHKEIQANTFFVLKTVGGALADMRGYFHRDYFIEKIEHMIDNASYTSVYEDIGMAPKQRFISTGGYLVQIVRDDQNRLNMQDISGWLVP